MNESTVQALEFAQGPLLRVAIGLLVLGSLRAIALALADVIAAWLTTQNKAHFWYKLRMNVMWGLFPTLVLRKARPEQTRHMFGYHLCLCFLAAVQRAGTILVPLFMIAHVHLMERATGFAWPTFSGSVTNALAIITLVAGFLVFLGRLYSPMLRSFEPPWTFVKPLILVVPFFTGYMAMHPRWSPLDWHFMMLLHVLSACLVMVMVPFGRLLACIHTKLVDLAPELSWRDGKQRDDGRGVDEGVVRT